MTDPTSGPGSGPGDGIERFADDGRRYRLDSRIATGGMGEVWRGTDTVLGRPVAVKLLKHEYADDPTFRSRFETEARHAGSLHHPGIAAVFDFGEGSSDDGSGAQRPYLVMELVDGQPLSAVLRPGEPMDPDAVRDLLGQAAAAIGTAHAAGIVHRDIKPANLLVTPDRQVKITDFGIARAADAMAITQTGQVMGTPQYLSPEQARGSAATPASDVYSLGVVAFECLAGRRPFTADSPVATALAHLREPVPPLPPEVPQDLAAVVRTAMAKDPHDRFADGAEFAQALRDPATAATAIVPPPVAGAGDTGDHTQVLAGAGAAGLAGAGAAGLAGAAAADQAPPTGTGPVPAPAPDGGRRRRGALWLLLGALVVLALVALAFVVLGNTGDDTQPTQNPTKSAHPHKRHSTTSQPTTAAPTTTAPSATRSPSATASSSSPSQSPSSSPTQAPSTSAPTTSAPPTSSAPTSASSSPAATSSSAAASQAPQSQGTASSTPSAFGSPKSRPAPSDHGKVAR